MKGLIGFVLAGFLAGVGLSVSGMTNPAKVTGFLDFAGNWDPTLLFVMGGAVAVFAVLNVLIHRRSAPYLCGTLPGVRGATGIDRRLVLGAALFGVGWGLAGVCPGPAVTDLALLRTDVLAFVGAMVGGMLLAQRGFGADAPPAPVEVDVA